MLGMFLMPIRNNTWRPRCGIKKEEEILMLLLEGNVHIVDFEQTQESCWLMQCWCVWMAAPSVRVGFEHAAGGSSPKTAAGHAAPLPVPILLMWLPHVHSLASTQLGKLFIRKKIVNHCFYRLPRMSPALLPTPNTVVWGEENFLGRNLVPWLCE